MSNIKKNFAPPSLPPILLTHQEYEDLKSKYPGIYEEEIRSLSEYIASSGKRYHSHYATLLKFCREDAPEIDGDEEERREMNIRKNQERIRGLFKKGREWKAAGKPEEDLQLIRYEIIAIVDSLKNSYGHLDSFKAIEDTLFEQTKGDYDHSRNTNKWPVRKERQERHTQGNE